MTKRRRRKKKLNTIQTCLIFIFVSLCAVSALMSDVVSWLMAPENLLSVAICASLFVGGFISLILILFGAFLFTDFVTERQRNKEELQDFNLSSETAVEFVAEKSKSVSVDAPRWGEYLLWILLPPEGREEVIGDINEIFHRLVHKFGLRRARFWYWCEVFKSLGPLLVRAVKFVAGWDIIERLIGKIGR